MITALKFALLAVIFVTLGDTTVGNGTGENTTPLNAVFGDAVAIVVLVVVAKPESITLYNLFAEALIASVA